MANYYGMARSNYFLVKDEAAFRKALKPFDVEIQSRDKEPGVVALFGNDPDGFGWPLGYYDDQGELVEVNLVDVIRPHLVDGWVCIMMDIGHEKLRYSARQCAHLGGSALAFNNKREMARVDLEDIYQLAEQLGEHATKATY